MVVLMIKLEKGSDSDCEQMLLTKRGGGFTNVLEHLYSLLETRTI